MSDTFSLESFVYPLKKTIRLELDEFSTFDGSSRSCQPVQIGRTKWVIITTMECSHRTDKKSFFGIYVKNQHAFENKERIECSTYFRVLKGDNSENIKPENITSIFDEQQSIWGSAKMIEKSRLLNDGFVKNGNLTIECDLTILSEQISGNISELKKKRPNNNDIEMMLAEPVFKIKRKVIEMEFEMSQIKCNSKFSHVVYIDEVPFKIKVRNEISDSKDWLAVYLYCNFEDKSEWWRVEASADFHIINRTDASDAFCKSITPGKFQLGTTSLGRDFILWKELLDSGSKYTKHGRIAIEAIVTIHNKYGFNEETGKGIEKPMKMLTDAKIQLDGEEFFVSKMILSHHSGWFCDYFSTHPNRSFFIINGDSKMFINFLRLVYNIEHEWEEEDFPKMLDFLEKYRAEECITRLESKIKTVEEKDDMKMLKLIDRYSLPNLKAIYVNKLKNPEELKKVFRHPDVTKLSDKFRDELMMDDVSKPEDKEDEPYYVYSKQPKPSGKASPEERFQKLLLENEGTRKFMEDPANQNTGNKVLQFLAQTKSNETSPPSYEEFSDQSDMVTFDFKDGKVFHLSKQILANASHYFMRNYFSPEVNDDEKKKNNSMILDGITSNDFSILLNHVYHPTKPVTDKNLDVLLTLAQRFSFTEIMKKCESYMITKDTLTLSKKEEYAKKYDLEYLMSACKNYKMKNQSSK